jgi:hypothetical protein
MICGDCAGRIGASVTIAQNALANAYYALEKSSAAMHNTQAFQASSPKNFHGRSCTGRESF